MSSLLLNKFFNRPTPTRSATFHRSLHQSLDTNLITLVAQNGSVALTDVNAVAYATFLLTLHPSENGLRANTPILCFYFRLWFLFRFLFMQIQCF